MHPSGARPRENECGAELIGQEMRITNDSRKPKMSMHSIDKCCSFKSPFREREYAAPGRDGYVFQPEKKLISSNPGASFADDVSYGV